MHFIDRRREMERLDGLASRTGGGLAVVYGRRRIGKTRLLLEWVRRHSGAYTVADQSSAEVQRSYLAEAISEHLPGFADVKYPDWSVLLVKLAREAKQVGWRGPVVIDELPYLVTASPELPSVLQRWIDHQAREAIECYAAWGGVPRYWELAFEKAGTTAERIDRLVLDPMGPLHQEPDRLLIEEHPPAIEVRPVLDAIGMGANRVSEIAGRIGHQATSLARPLDRISSMGLVKREIPFGESEKKSKRSLYRIADPFIRLWFRVVAPHRAYLATASRGDRLDLLAGRWPEQVRVRD